MDPYNLDSKVTVKPLQNGHLFITINFLGSVKRYKTNPNLRKNGHLGINSEKKGTEKYSWEKIMCIEK